MVENEETAAMSTFVTLCTIIGVLTLTNCIMKIIEILEGER